VSEASFVVGAGEKVGLVGRNGTGKSSFISVVVGEPTPQLRHRGNVRLLGSFGFLPQAPVPAGLGLEPTGFSHILSARGLDVLDDALGAARAAMSEDPSEENIELFADLQEKFQSNGGYEAESVMARLADGLGLRQELLLEDIDSLSGGQRRRVDLAASLVTQPELLVLDEPTTGLDPRSRQVVWATIRELVQEGVTLLLTTQYLEEADALADSIHLIDHGRSVAAGTPSELKARIGDQRVDVVAVDSAGVDTLAALLGARFDITVTPARRMVSIPAPDEIVDLTAVADLVRTSGVAVDEVALRRPTLDDAFMALTGQPAETQAADDSMAGVAP